MRNIKCEEILKRKDYLGLNISDFEEQVNRFCLSKLNEYEVEPSRLESLKKCPEKRYEIFRLNFTSGNKKIFMLETSLIDYDENMEERELYYSSIIAKRICDNMKRIDEDAINGISEIENEYENDIIEIKENIKSLQELDKDEYNIDSFAYNALLGTGVIEELEEERDEENKKLKEELRVAEEKIADLTNKLRISLTEIEKNRKNLNLNTSSQFEKFINKIKKIINK